MIKTSWQKVKLGDLLRGVVDNRGKTPPLSDKGYKMIEVYQLSREKRYLDLASTDKQKYVDENTYREWFRDGHPKEKDILISTVGTIGQWSMMPPNTEVCIAQNVVALRPDKRKVTPEYLFYYFNQRKFIGQVSGLVIGATQPSVRLPHFLSLEIDIPDIKTQSRIASILSAFDDKIELNNKINAALEKMAQAIFKEWFVKFRFPGHEKARFVDSELGKIPRGWEVKQLKDIIKLNKGLSYKSSEIKEESVGVPMVNLKNFKRGGGFKEDGIKYYMGKYKEQHVVKPGQLVIAMTDLTPTREVVGRPALIPDLASGDTIISLDVVSVEIQSMYYEYLYFLMKRPEFGELMANSASGTTVAHLQKSSIENYQFVSPTGDVIRKFHKLASPMFAKKNMLSSENKNLSKQRDLLLPKLMKGEVRV